MSFRAKRGICFPFASKGHFFRRFQQPLKTPDIFLLFSGRDTSPSLTSRSRAPPSPRNPSVLLRPRNPPSLPHFCQCLRSILLRSQQHPERPLQRLDPLRRKPLALQPDGVRAETLRFPLGHHQRKRRHILRDDSARADVSVAPQPAKLVHRAKRADGHIILHRYVARERRAIYEQRVVSHLTIVSHMRIRQKKILTPNAGSAAAFDRSPADGHVLTKNVPIAGGQFHALPAVCIVLRI